MDNSGPFFEPRDTEVEDFLAKNPPKEKMTSKDVYISYYQLQF